ncbi:MAG: hypothetical protein LBR78_00265 [Holosporales bacterium]|jgi:hypothetical protein|nr:hypothetical protein [Holosporales bacterium]
MKHCTVCYNGFCADVGSVVLKQAIVVTSLVVAVIGVKLYVDHEVRHIRRHFDGEIRNLQSDKKTFSEIYKTHSFWGTPEHLSGLASAKKYAMPCIEYVQNFINTTELKTIYDFGCGSYEWMQHVVVPKNVQYYGVDVVDSVIQANKEQYEKDNIHFVGIDSTDDFMKYKGDLLIVKDVFDCWNTERTQYFLDNVLPNFRYAIIVGYYSLNGKNNRACDATGPAHNRDMEAAPFNLKCKESKIYEIHFDEEGKQSTAYKKIVLWVNPTYVSQGGNGESS